MELKVVVYGVEEFECFMNPLNGIESINSNILINYFLNFESIKWN